MSPDYGATCGFFAVDEKTLEYYRMTGREQHVDAIESYLKAQGMFGIPKKGEIDYSQVVELDLDTVRPSVSGPKRPQDRINLESIGARFTELFSKPVADGGYGKAAADLTKRLPVPNGMDVAHGDILNAAIPACTNTSNPWMLRAAGLVAKMAFERGMKPNPRVKTSLAPGSKVVTAYLRDSGLLPYLEEIGYHVVAYGCTTCMGLAGPLDAQLEETVVKNDLITCAVLSGNRNFEARVHQSLKANFLMSPPLVVAFALAGTVLKDTNKDPIGNDKNGKPVYLKDLWPTSAEVAAVMKFATNSENFKREYGDLSGAKDLWEAIPEAKGALYQWDNKSTYLLEPPLFEGFKRELPKVNDVRGARALGIYGDSLTTDHISPVSPIRKGTLAGEWLIAAGSKDLSSFGSRRTNHEVMVRGAFANPRIKNLLVPGSEGSVTVHQPSGDKMTMYEAAMRYQKDNVPLFVFGGEEYGTGSSRDWAAKGTQMLGIKVVVARGYERIHRSNLVGMGVLPCQFKGSDSVQSLKIDGTETFDLIGVAGGNVKPMQDVTLVIHRKDGSTQNVTVTLRVDSPIEVEYLKHGGILPYVLRELMAA
jgi:aconitate hydratase